jgi:hypothetical protein
MTTFKKSDASPKATFLVIGPGAYSMLLDESVKENDQSSNFMGIIV